jgi:TonB family protein
MPSEPEPADLLPHSYPELTQALERQIAAGFPPELAFDLMLHELVVRACAATRADAAALALTRGSEMVCRAATGLQAPDLGVPLNTREGLSGICLQTHLPQNCYDTEVDPLVDADAARRLGIRSMLIVPVLESDVMLGILEVFSSKPGAFSQQDQALLENFANDCVRLNRTMDEARLHPPTGIQPLPLVAPAQQSDASIVESLSALEYPPQPEAPFRLYEGWTLVLGAIVIFAAAALSFMIGSRIGWIRTSLSPAAVPASKVVASAPAAANVVTPTGAAPSVRKDAARTDSANPKSGELVVYDHGKVVFRMKPASKSAEPVVAAAENARLNNAKVWLAPEQAELRLRNRVEPTYPAAALAAHSSGEVVLEVVVGEDGSVVNAHGLSGDPLLTSAALDAVRQWQYEPYRSNQRPTQFQTDVTLRFSLPN